MSLGEFEGEFETVPIAGPGHGLQESEAVLTFFLLTVATVAILNFGCNQTTGATMDAKQLKIFLSNGRYDMMVDRILSTISYKLLAV